MTMVRPVIFTILVPGTIAWWIPSLLSREWPAQFDIAPWNYAGIALILLGALFYFRSAISFLTEGKGTPAIWFTRPIKFLLGEEPGVLVSQGFYTKTRNPMYLGVVICVLGEAVFFEQWVLLLYSTALWLFFHIVIVFVEEPHLRKKHGISYEQYCSSAPRWISLRHNVRGNEALMSRARGDIIFLGDSITEGCDWAGLFNNPRIKNHGIGGDTSEGILRRLEPIVDSQPRQIFLMAGINNLWEGVAVETVAANFRQILLQCKQKTPTTQVIIQSTLPMNRSWSSTPERIPIVNATVVDFNTALQALAHEFRCPYVDLHSLLLKEGQLDPRYTYDGLHLNADAYEVWRSAIQHLIATES